MRGRCPACGGPDRGEAQCPACGFNLGRWRHRDIGDLPAHEQTLYEEELNRARRHYIEQSMGRLEEKISRLASISSSAPRGPASPASPLISVESFAYIIFYTALFGTVAGGLRYIIGQLIPLIRNKFIFQIPGFVFLSDSSASYSGHAWTTLLMGIVVIGWLLLIMHEYERT